MELESLQARHQEELSTLRRKISQMSDVGPGGPRAANRSDDNSRQEPHRSSSAPQPFQQFYYAPLLYQDLSPIHSKFQKKFQK